MIILKIGTCINFRDIDSISKKFETIKQHGIDSCQIISWNKSIRTDENAETLKNLIKEHCITVSAFWCGWSGPQAWNFYEGQTTLGLIPKKYREERIKDLKQGADFALKLGITDVATHMGFIPENPYDPNFLPFCDAVREVAEHLKFNGQNLLFETGQETPVAMLRCFETVGTDNLAVNLDTANLILYGKANPVDALDVFGKYVRNIHVKDGLYPTDGKNLGKETRLGDGKVDFKALLIKLRELGYDSYLTIEREITGEKQLEDVIFAKSYLENILKEIGG